MRSLPFVLAATDQGTFIVNYRDGRLSDDKNRGIGIGFQLLAQGEAEREEVEILAQMLHERRQMFGDGVVAVDCGANIGVFSCVWAREMTGWGSVVAIEAQPRLFYALCGNIALGNYLNARALNLVLSNEDGIFPLTEPNYEEWGSFGSLELRPRADGSYEDIGQPIDHSRPTCRVAMRRIDGLGFQRVDLLKIDVEGMEVEVLQGARHTIQRYRPAIFVERGKAPDDALMAELIAQDYVVRDVPSGWLCVAAEHATGEKVAA